MPVLRRYVVLRARTPSGGGLHARRCRLHISASFAPRRRAPQAPPETVFNTQMRDLLLRQTATGGALLLFNAGSLPGLYRLATTGVPDVNTPAEAYVVAQVVVGMALCGLPLAQLGKLLDGLNMPITIKMRRDTELLTLSTFGSKSQPVAAAVVALGLSLWTGVTEEVAFRGCLMPRLAEMFHSAPLGVAASSLLFGLAHWSFDVSVESAFLLTLQTFYGFCFALCYLLFDGPGTATLWDGTTSDVTLTGLLAAIGAHTLYDFRAFYDTHNEVAGQVAYTRRSLVSPPEVDAGGAVLERVRDIASENELDEGFLTLTKTVFYYLDTNQDGYVDSKELRSGLCTFGSSLRGTDGSQPPSMRDVSALIESVDEDANQKLDIAEFLELVLKMEGNPMVMVSSLLYTP